MSFPKSQRAHVPQYLTSRIASPNLLLMLAVTSILAGPSHSAHAQTGEWTWKEGSSADNTPGVYGTLGQPAAGNIPGSRYAAATWSDGRGNLWLFGGYGYDASGTQGGLNDLWEFNPSTNEWAWMGGSNTICNDQANHGVWGTLGIASARDIPGCRDAAATWTDDGGHFWLLGGTGIAANGNDGYLNDLWEFSPARDEWVWVGGSNTVNTNRGDPGVYGTLGTPAAGNTPGGRASASSWTDSSGHLWLFGGTGFDVNGNGGALNDLWEFNSASDKWAWMGGSKTVGTNQGNPGVYGTLGTPAAGNTPGSRSTAAVWIDSADHLWLFGGYGFDANGNLSYLNDLWEFDPSTNEWAWMDGSSAAPGLDQGKPGVYGKLGAPGAANISGSRENASNWVDSSGHFWLFGGYGFDAKGNQGILNDLWEFNPATKEWAWMSGSSTVPCLGCGEPGVYGTLGSPAAGNAPGSRLEAASWADRSDHFWLFGGWGIASQASGAPGILSDLWEYTPYTSVPSAAEPSFGVQAGTYSKPLTVSISDSTPGATIYYNTNGTAPTISSTKYTGAISVTASVTIEAIAIASGYSNSPLASAKYTIVYAPTLNWATPSAITYGTALTSAQLDATASYNGTAVAGSFSYSPVAGTVLGAGAHTLKVTFTPTDSSLYATTTASVTLFVNQATPSLTWVTPKAITYGTALSEAQLNARAIVAGTYTYSPAAGAIPKPGTTTLSVTFSPKDATDYTTVATTVALSVNKAVLTVAANNASKVYGAALPTLGYTISGLVDGDIAAQATTGLPILSTTAAAKSAVGSFPITVAIGTLAAANYSFVVKPGTLAVTKATLTVTANNMSSVYGNPIPAFIATLTGFANGDTASSAVTGVARFSTPATDTSNVGAYAITPEIGTLAAANYSFQFKVGTLTITRAVLTITATDQSIEHGSPLPVLTYTLSGFAAGESLSGALTGTPSLSTTAKSSSPVGTYAINVGAGTLAATNYSFKFVNATLTITAAETN